MRAYKEIMESGKVWDIKIIGGIMYGFVKLPDCGTCSVAFGNNEDGYEHVSVSPKHRYRIPSWDDMCALKDIFFRDEEEAYQIHPKKSEYVLSLIHLSEVSEMSGDIAKKLKNVKSRLRG